MNSKNILVILVGATYSRSFLFYFSQQEIKLISMNETFSTEEPDLIIESLKSKFKGQFDELIVSQDKEGPFQEALQQFSGTGNVKAVDIGSSETLLGSASFGKVKVTKLEWGVGRGGRQILLGLDKTTKLASWLANFWKLADIENLVAHQSIYPGVIPVTNEHMELNLGLAREVLRELVKRGERPEVSTVKEPTLSHSEEHFNESEGESRVSTGILPTFILSGAVLGRSPHAGQALLSFLDGAGLEGFFQVFLDRNLLFSALGALAGRGFALPLAQSMLSSDLSYFNRSQSPVSPFGEGGGVLTKELGFENLGTVIVLSHQYREGKMVAELILDLGLDENLEVQVQSGELVRVPFEENSTGDVILSLKGRVKIVGLSEPKIKVEGGRLGLIIDGRGRPLSRPSVNEEGRQKLKQWMETLT